MNRLFIKAGKQLTKEDVSELNRAITCVWPKVSEMSPQQLEETTHFILKNEEGQFLAQGQILTIEPFVFNKERFSILGIGWIIAREKGKGYGRELLNGIKSYLLQKKKTGVGFCNEENRPFYEKCGFNTAPGIISRFVYYEGEQKLLNSHNDTCVFYLDSEDHFMEKVLAKPQQEVRLPRRADW